MDRTDLPLGFGFALAQNPEAMKHFSALSAPQQEELLQQARAVRSKAEMHSLANSLSARG